MFRIKYIDLVKIGHHQTNTVFQILAQKRYILNKYFDTNRWRTVLIRRQVYIQNGDVPSGYRRSEENRSVINE